MTLTARELELLEGELGGVVGGIVRAVRCPSVSSVWLEVRACGQNMGLLLAAAPRMSRVHRTTSRPSQRDRPTAFVMMLRKRVLGSEVIAISRLPADRMWRLHLGRRGTPMDSLVLRWRHNMGNLYLLDSDEQTVLSLLPTTDDASPLHQIPPPDSVRQALEADRIGLSSLPEDGSRSRAVEEYYESLIQQRETQARVHERNRRLRRALKRARRLLLKIEADLAKVDKAPLWRRYGELLTGSYGTVKTGASSVMVQDFYDPMLAEVEIPLDPSQDLAANIARYFSRYRRYKNARSQVEFRHRQAQERVRAIDTALENPDLTLDELIEAGVLRRNKAAQATKPSQQRQCYREFTSQSGLRILVGRGGADNDHLTLKIARGRDVWLHARDWAGAHVIIQLNKGTEPDHDTLMDAALLAAHYSKGKENTFTDVRYTLAKHVKKPKGAPAGRVTVAGAKNIAVRQDPSRLERLMQARTAL